MRARLLEKTAPVALTNEIGEFRVIAYNIAEGPRVATHLAVIHGQVAPAMPVRINSACLTSEALLDDRCDCAWQLHEALRSFVRRGTGVLLYHPDHEGRGIGLFRKVESYGLMTQGLTTCQAFLALGEPADARSFEPALIILADLGITSVSLLSNNPAKADALREGGIDVRSTEELVAHHNPGWHDYLASKAIEFGHRITPHGLITTHDVDEVRDVRR